MQYWKAVRKINRNTFETGNLGESKTTTFKIGKTYEVPGNPKLCKNGFHFYRKENFCFGAELFGKNTEFIEIEPLSEIIKDTEKCCCTKIKVIRYVPKKERKLDQNNNSGDYNSGNRNSGSFNSGSYNSGSCNSGNNNLGNYNSGFYNLAFYNSGHNNSGSFNSGHYNSGRYNSGDWNSGNYNSGFYNSGHKNSGNYNSGNYNSGNYNSGNGYKNKFCTNTKYFLFNIEVSEEVYNKTNMIPMGWFNLTGKTYKEAWANCPPEVLEMFSEISEFQTEEAKEIFFEITGLKIS